MGNAVYQEIAEDKVSKRANTFIIAALIAICLFHIINNCLWIGKDVLSWYPEKYYQLIHKNTIFFSLESILASGQSLPEKIISFLKSLNTDSGCGWGVIFYIYTACFNLAFGNSIGVSLAANLPFFILLIIFTFLIGKEIAGAKEGLFAAFLVSFYPGIYGMSRSYGVDFPLVAMVTVSIYILIAKNVAKIRYSLLFGLVSGLTLLIKLPGAYFLIGPAVYIFFDRVRQVVKASPQNSCVNKHIFQVVFASALFAGISFLLLNFGWGSGRVEYVLNCVYSINFPMFIERRHFYWVCPYNIGEWKSIFFYMFEAVHSMSRLLFLLFCAGSVLFLIKKIKYKMVILLWVIVPYIILMLSVNKWGRYYLPVFPALALITAVGIFQIKEKKYRIFLVALAVFISFVQFYDLSFGASFFPRVLYRHPAYSFTAYPPRQRLEGKIVAGFLKIINKEHKGLNYKPKVLFIAPHSHIDLGRMEYLFQTEAKNVEFTKFFMAGSGYEDCDYAIVLNDKARRINYPDLAFLKIPGYYADFLKISYPQYSLTNEELAKMSEFFAKFEVVDYYFAGKTAFYLCKNNYKK
ncbi:MAG: glycosyltransferase family 39 protein [Candidatus Omnitrophica bacterium]|nr:glycosyltransferase family 39 protein [Candidatus Omnitrophota bacterium]